MTPRSLVGVILLVLAAAWWIGPSAAFNSANLGTRAIEAVVTTDGNAYLAPILLTCDVSRVLGGPCSFAVYNNGTANVTISATLQSQSSNVVDGFTVDDNAPVGGVATGDTRNVGDKSIVTATLDPCLPCNIVTIEWVLNSSLPKVLEYRTEHLAMTVDYG